MIVRLVSLENSRLDYADQNLRDYATDLVTHAHDALVKRAKDYYPTIHCREMYIAALNYYKDFSTEQLADACADLRASLLHYMPDDDENALLKDLRDFYFRHIPMNETKYGNDINIRALHYAAARDMVRFCNAFMTHKHADERDLLPTVLASLDAQWLGYKYDRSMITYFAAEPGEAPVCEIFMLSKKQCVQRAREAPNNAAKRPYPVALPHKRPASGPSDSL